jgi:hypothetical protein
LDDTASADTASPDTLAEPPVIESIAPGEALVLEGVAIDSTWVQVQWDGDGTTEEIIPRGERRRWVARDSILVRAGRAHGIHFFCQGQLLGEGRLGDATKVLRFRATREHVTLLGPDLLPIARVADLQSSPTVDNAAAGP